MKALTMLVAAAVLGSSATSVAGWRGTVPTVAAPVAPMKTTQLTLGELPLTRAKHGIIALTAPYPISMTFNQGFGIVVAEVALEPSEIVNPSNDEKESAKGVRIAINGVRQTTATFQQEVWNNSSGGRCNAHGRRVQFNPPLIVQPGDTVDLTLMYQSQMSGEWTVAPATTSATLSVGYWVALPGEV